VPEGAEVVSFPMNRGVSIAWNAAAARATGSVLCFVNDDVLLGNGSLRLLHAALERLPDAGVVGPVGTDWDIDAASHQRYLSTDDLEPGEARECNVVSGFLFATPAEDHAAVGGFDEAFTPCGFEEVDYCTAVRRRLGRRCYVVAGVEHAHEFGISARRPWTRVRHNGKSETIGRIHRRNRRHFLEKWSPGQTR
jgi:GT2 family glycosyltransferase